MISPKSTEFSRLGSLETNNKWKKTKTRQHAILVPSLLVLILEKPDMPPEEFLSIAAKMIREECIRPRLKNRRIKNPLGTMIHKETTS